MYWPNYCERQEDHWAAEPLNLTSNLAFIVAGIWIFLRAHNSACPRWIQVFAVFVSLIGLGSASFHAIPSTLTLVLDIAPIVCCVVFYLCVYLRMIYGHGVVRQTAAIALLAILTALMILLVPAELTNGSSDYLGVWLMMIILTLFDRHAQKFMAGAVVIFSVSLLIRSLDLWVCLMNPRGVHFLWHCMNATLLGYLAHRLDRSRISGS